MCTALLYTGGNGSTYIGRTLEMDVNEPYVLGYVPAGTKFTSQVDGSEPVEYRAKHGFVGVAAPASLPEPGQSFTPDLEKASEGLNDAGLTISMLAYPTTPGDGDETADAGKPPLNGVDVGTWILGQFSTVEEVKQGLKDQPIHLPRLALVGNALFPFHFLVGDTTGASIVIQWNHGKLGVYDNPVGVLTNGPEFPWHLTNLNNWTHLSNVDVNVAHFGSMRASQPDSGIATTLLPPSNTAVGRFVKAVYFNNFAEKPEDPDKALLTLARVMDNFDRPRGATIDPPSDEGGAGISFQGTEGESRGVPTEYTAVTFLSDMKRGEFFLRSYDAFNFSRLDLKGLSKADRVHMMPVEKLDAMGGDATEALLST